MTLICLLICSEGELNALCTRIQHQKLRNDQLDFEIGSLNLDVNEQQKQHDPDLEEEIGIIQATHS